MRISAPMASIILLLLALSNSAQDLPDKIRGYKVYKAKVQVIASADAPKAAADGDALVNVGEPRLVSVGITGVTFETMADIGVIPQSGRIDFLMFRGFTVNGIAVDFDEFKHSFDVKKGVAIKLPKPIRAFVSSINIVKAVYKEMVESKPTWNVSGTVFVFGSFRKFGFKFKRVVPVKIELTVKNPLA